MNLENVRVWAADQTQYGPGKLHIIDEDNHAKTMCGRMLSGFPGHPVSTGRPTCKICCDALARRPERKRREAEWAAESEEFRKKEAARLAEREAWWKRYNAYLRSPEWKAISARVIARANGLCEGCGRATATQAHHLTYENAFNEFLWELRAVCKACHDRAHRDTTP